MAEGAMNLILKRSVRVISPESDNRFEQKDLSLSDFESDHGYVLLGEPGIGKTTEFDHESKRLDAQPFIPARRFISRDLGCHPEWKKAPLFIDGLDEVRAISGDSNLVLDKIVCRLEQLGTPEFRLSCRSGDWLDKDLKELHSLLNPENFLVLELNPLRLHDIRTIVNHNGMDADEFVQKAYDHDLLDLLFNPQLLALLLKSMGTAGWPNSPTQSFEKACTMIIQEQNSDHRDTQASRPAPCRKEVLQASGMLSALMLIANKSGWAASDTDDHDLLCLNQIEDSDPSILLAALHSNLFRGRPDHRTPRHRFLAEFLGAQYLDRKIREGISIRRVFQLLMGSGYAPYTDLRGLAAWLAAFNQGARSVLIQRDPIATAFYGDPSSFNLDERTKLVQNLEQELHLARLVPSKAASGALNGDYESSVIWKLTKEPDRSENREHLVSLLLDGFSVTAYAKGRISDAYLKSSQENLLNIIKDPSWNSFIRTKAIIGLNHLLHRNADRDATLKQLLQDLREDRLPDVKNDLMGTLLHLLYPQELRPEEIWSHLTDGSAEYTYNSYQKFWKNLSDQSDEHQVQQLLDSLCTHASEIIPKLANHAVARIVLQLLDRGLNLFGDRLEITDLYRWFDLIEYDHAAGQLIPIHCSGRSDYTMTDRESCANIRNWLREHKETQCKLLEFGLIEWEPKTGQESLPNKITFKFLDQAMSNEFRSHCMNRAGEIYCSKPKVAKQLAWIAIWEMEGSPPPLTENEIKQAVSKMPCLQQWNEERLEAKAQEEHRLREFKKKHSKILERSLTQKQEEIEYLHQQKSKLEAGICNPKILFDLAQVYFYGFTTEGEDPRSLIQSHLDDNASLTDATLSGFRALLDREDLPDLNQIAEQFETDQLSYFSHPFLAGMEEEKKETDDVLLRLDKKGRRRALGFYFVAGIPQEWDNKNLYLTPQEISPSWYKQALKYYPVAVAESLLAVHNACVRIKKPPIGHMFDLASDPKYVPVAKLVLDRMFTVFPTRCTKQQLESLRLVLWSALKPGTMSVESLRNLVRKRLGRKKMDLGQRAYWLCTGLFVARDFCFPLIEDFLTPGSFSRVQHFVNFLAHPGHHRTIQHSLTQWAPKELSQMIRLLGKHLKEPYPKIDRARFLEDQEIASRDFLHLIDLCLTILSKRTTQDAIAELDCLSSDPMLEAWNFKIQEAQKEQTRRTHAANRLDLDVQEIQNTLNQGPPASAEDLCALTVDVLEELADQIRNDSTNIWRYYWDYDQENRKFLNPVHENKCRDLLLSHLKMKLENYRVDAQPEGQYAEETRADIRVSYKNRFAIPIEIKKNSHPGLWKGIRTQLVPRYTRDPMAHGHGIYLVLWFGKRHTEVIPPNGPLPNKPEDVKLQLEQDLDPVIQGKIQIVIVDVSLPDGMDEKSS